MAGVPASIFIFINRGTDSKCSSDNLYSSFIHRFNLQKSTVTSLNIESSFTPKLWSLEYLSGITNFQNLSNCKLVFEFASLQVNEFHLKLNIFIPNLGCYTFFKCWNIFVKLLKWGNLSSYLFHQLVTNWTNCVNQNVTLLF